MKYTIKITQRAVDEITEFIAYVRDVKVEPLNATRVSEAIYDAILHLDQMPHRCPRAPESDRLSVVVRMLIVKRSLLVLYCVDDERRIVTVVGFRHASRSPLELPEHS